MKRFLFAPLAAVTLCAAAASSETIDLSIAAAKVGEVCMPLRTGDTLAWQFDASAPTDFNVHHHVGKQVLMPIDRKAVAADRAQLTADRSNDWCLMWTAPKAQAVTVRGTWRVTRAR